MIWEKIQARPFFTVIAYRVLRYNICIIGFHYHDQREEKELQIFKTIEDWLDA